MQWVSSRIWTRVAVFISYDDNNYITGNSKIFKYFIPNIASYFRYIDDILLIYLQDLDWHSITDRLNNVETSLKFTYELEYNSTLPFLDILFIRNINKLEFKVNRKPTCKNDHIHFYSHHNNSTKRGIIIGFYLSAVGICSSKHLNDEFNYICNILICRCMQEHIQHNKDERTQSFRKIYLSLVTKGIICERWVGDWTELQHTDPPTLLATAAFLSRSPGLLNRGPSLY